MIYYFLSCNVFSKKLVWIFKKYYFFQKCLNVIIVWLFSREIQHSSICSLGGIILYLATVCTKNSKIYFCCLYSGEMELSEISIIA